MAYLRKESCSYFWQAEPQPNIFFSLFACNLCELNISGGNFAVVSVNHAFLCARSLDCYQRPIGSPSVHRAAPQRCVGRRCSGMVGAGAVSVSGATIRARIPCGVMSHPMSWIDAAETRGSMRVYGPRVAMAHDRANRCAPSSLARAARRHFSSQNPAARSRVSAIGRCLLPMNGEQCRDLDGPRLSRLAVASSIRAGTPDDRLED